MKANSRMPNKRKIRKRKKCNKIKANNKIII